MLSSTLITASAVKTLVSDPEVDGRIRLERCMCLQVGDAVATRQHPIARDHRDARAWHARGFELRRDEVGHIGGIWRLCDRVSGCRCEDRHQHDCESCHATDSGMRVSKCRDRTSQNRGWRSAFGVRLSAVAVESAMTAGLRRYHVMRFHRALMLTFRTTLAVGVLLMAACAARGTRVTSAADIARADQLVVDGCYRCLQEALAIYERLLSAQRPIAGALRQGVFETAFSSCCARRNSAFPLTAALAKVRALATGLTPPSGPPLRSGDCRSRGPRANGVERVRSRRGRGSQHARAPDAIDRASTATRRLRRYPRRWRHIWR